MVIAECRGEKEYGVQEGADAIEARNAKRCEKQYALWPLIPLLIDEDEEGGKLDGVRKINKRVTDKGLM